MVAGLTRCGLVLGLAGICGCTTLLDADDTTFAPQQTTPPPPPPRLGAILDAKRIAPPRKAGLFGTAISISGDTMAVAAPYEDVTTERGIVSQGGAVYLFDLQAEGSTPRRLTIPGIQAGEGTVGKE